ncbi:flagellar protein FlaG [bacterium]|nr:flagellar protein FlaG [bacterium]
MNITSVSSQDNYILPKTVEKAKEVNPKEIKVSEQENLQLQKNSENREIQQTNSAEIDSKKDSENVDANSILHILKEMSEEFEKQNINVKVSFSFKDNYDLPVIELMDSKSEKVIRQIPSEEFIKRMENLEELRGLFFHTKA